MKNSTIKNKSMWAVGLFIVLCVFYLLCRFTFFDLHGMKEWPLNLFIFGSIVIAIAAVFNCRRIMCCTVVGYMVGFVLGMLFNTDGVEQGGGTTNNAWIIWTVSFVIIILMGTIWELLNKHLKKRNAI